MSARSVVLSLLLGAPRSGLPVSDVLAVTREVGLGDSTVRASLSRLVAADDATARDSVYRLAERHVRRQQAQEAALHPDLRVWDGTWAMLVVTGTGRTPAARAELRRSLTTDHRMAELREGVWTRPDNLADPLPLQEHDGDVVVMRSRPDDAAALTARLWDTAAWAASGHGLMDAAARAATLRERFVVNAAIVRHLRHDPWLPVELLPDEWPAADLRRTYEAFRVVLATLASGRSRIGASATVRRRHGLLTHRSGPHHQEDA